MNPAVVLSEFMPYGAPELLAARKRHLSQALSLASAGAVALYGLTVALASLRSSAPAIPIQSTIDVIIDPPPPILNYTASKPTVLVPKSPSQPAVPVPVPDPMPTPVDAQPPGPSAADVGKGTDVPLGPGPSDVSRPAGAVLPPFRTFTPVEQLPEVVTQVKPTYPELPMLAGVEGLVMVHVLVDVDGRVRDARVDERQHVPMLDEAALEAARRWVFTPGMMQNHPVACWTAIPFRFRLR